MKFSGEIKFPEVDHPGVPVTFVIDGHQAELLLDGESLGRWSLYDVHARRLISSAFSIDLAGTEVTFVAADPIDFAYRGVEHMAEAWATIKSKQVARRAMAIRKSRRDTIPSRIPELVEAMQSNLERESRPIAGQYTLSSLGASDVDLSADTAPAEVSQPEPTEATTDTTSATEADRELERVEAELLSIREERERLALEREQLLEEKEAAEAREADRVEAFRIEMQRLEEEREQARLEAEQVRLEAEQSRIAAEKALQEAEQARAALLDSVPESAAVEGDVTEVSQPEVAAVPDEAIEDAEAKVEESLPEPEAEEPVAPAADVGGDLDEEHEPEEEQEERLATVTNIVDLSGLEGDAGESAAHAPLQPEPEPALSGASQGRSGLMGAVKAAFARGGGKPHDHQFVEAPGGIGITRFVCEECGHVSIAVGD